MNFLNPYSRNDYKDFFQNKLLTDDFEFIEEKLSLEFKPQYLKHVELLGRDKSLELDVYEILHESENDPRVGLSKDIFRLMSKYGAKRALAILYSPSSKNYRLSLATVELSLDGSKIKREYSNPRRYSFFLGPDSKIHTPSEFLISKGRVSDFDDLQNRFSIEVVNKEFYQRIAVQFSKLVGGTRKIGSHNEEYRRTLSLPSVTEQHIFQEFAVRLIGRLVFCWFLKMKKSDNNIPLISSVVLSISAAKSRSNYYHTVIEKLFFEVLNTPIVERRKEFKQDPYFSIPFLNGGLFSPHNEDYYETDRGGISKHMNTLKVPDKWIQDFIEILETYNFTVDENTSVDVDLSVDPEMLGRIFENLLAEINPETGESARKATGSYYTPRPIVEYMVDESLKKYLTSATNIEENKILGLLSYGDGTVDLNEKEINKIIDALDKVKILDPACGSGAFPIGILNKMVLILQRIDPKSKLWLEKQLARIDVSALRRELEHKLEGENVEYVHKLGIIQNSIYGVDIQPIATEISKLRCFLSLIVDEKVYDNRINRGILALPNLEFKFVAADTLTSLPKSSNQSELFNVDEEILKLEGLRKLYFTSSGKEKEKIEKDFLIAQKELATNYLSKQAKDNRAIKLANWDPFCDEASKWFESEWMFGVIDGFDIVIGNPPYIFTRENLTKDQKKFYKSNYLLTQFKINLYILFIEKAYHLIKTKNGILFFITPINWLSLPTNSDMRNYLLSHCCDIKIIMNYPNVFESASVDTLILGFSIRGKEICEIFEWSKRGIELLSCKSNSELLASSEFVISYGNSNQTEIVKLKGDLLLADVADVRNGVQAYTIGEGTPPCTKIIKEKRLYHSEVKKDSAWIKYLDGVDVSRYYLGWSGQYIKYGNNLSRPRKPELFKGERILVRQIPNQLPYCIHAAYTDSHTINDNNSMIIKILNENLHPKYVLAILNSKLISYWFAIKFGKLQRKIFPQFKINELRIFPINISNTPIQNKIVKLVDQIIQNKISGTDLITKKLDDQIDIIIYKIYKLNFDEIKIIDSDIEKIISKEDYEKMEI